MRSIDIDNIHRDGKIFIESEKGLLIIEPMRYPYISYIYHPSDDMSITLREVDSLHHLRREINALATMILSGTDVYVGSEMREYPNTVKVSDMTDQGYTLDGGSTGNLLTSGTYEGDVTLTGGSEGYRSNYGSNRLDGTTYGL